MIVKIKQTESNREYYKKYRTKERHAQAGDLVRIIDHASYHLNGKVFEVQFAEKHELGGNIINFYSKEEKRSYGTPFHIDERGILYQTLELVSLEIDGKTYYLSNEKPKKGDLIYISNPHNIGVDYFKGDIFETVESDGRHITIIDRAKETNRLFIDEVKKLSKCDEDHIKEIYLKTKVKIKEMPLITSNIRSIHSIKKII